MNNDTIKAYEMMLAKHCTCIVYSSAKSTLHASKERGVRPLLELIDSEADVKGFSAADRVVGKAAAFLYVKLGVKSVYANILSEPAKYVFQKNKIQCYANLTVPLIRNRDKTGYCPMESAVLDITDADEAYMAIKNKLKEMEG